MNALGGGGDGDGAATRASEASSPRERLQDSFPEVPTSVATDVAEPGGGFIQPGVYRSVMPQSFYAIVKGDNVIIIN